MFTYRFFSLFSSLEAASQVAWIGQAGRALNSSLKSLLSSAILRLISSSSLSTGRGGYFLLVLGDLARSGTLWGSTSSVRPLDKRKELEWLPACLYFLNRNMYRTMIINTITNREDRATITAIIGVSSEGGKVSGVVAAVLEFPSKGSVVASVNCFSESHVPFSGVVVYTE